MEENKTLIGTPNENGKAPETEEKPKSRVNVKTIEFESDAETTFMNGAMLREKIDSMFRSIWADYDCCRLQINDTLKPDIINKTIPVNAIYVDLLFRENDAGGFKALHRRSESKGSRTLDKLEYTLGGMSSRAYTIDPDVLEALEEFLPQNLGSKNKKKMTTDDWMRRVFESGVTTPAGVYPYGYSGGNFIEVAILGFPVEMMLKKIYGEKSEDGDAYDYSCRLMRSTIDGRDLVLQITQMRTATVNKLYNVIGMNNRMSQQFYNSPAFFGGNPIGY